MKSGRNHEGTGDGLRHRLVHSPAPDGHCAHSKSIQGRGRRVCRHDPGRMMLASAM